MQWWSTDLDSGWVTVWSKGDEISFVFKQNDHLAIPPAMVGDDFHFCGVGGVQLGLFVAIILLCFLHLWHIVFKLQVIHNIIIKHLYIIIPNLLYISPLSIIPVFTHSFLFPVWISSSLFLKTIIFQYNLLLQKMIWKIPSYPENLYHDWAPGNNPEIESSNWFKIWKKNLFRWGGGKKIELKRECRRKVRNEGRRIDFLRRWWWLRIKFEFNDCIGFVL